MSREALRERAYSHPIIFGIVLTLAWWSVLALLARTLSPLSPSWFPDLGPTLVNLGALAVPLAAIVVLRWWSRAGLAIVAPHRRWWLLLPLLLEALSYGVGGLRGTVTQVASSAALFAALGLNEELLNRGVIQHAANRLGSVRSVLWSAMVFGLAHLGNALVFGQPPARTGAQVVSATAFGLAYGAVRLQVCTIWPLALLHGLDDFSQTRSSGDIPWWWHLTVALLNVAYALWVLRRFSTQELEGPLLTPVSPQT